LREEHDYVYIKKQPEIKQDNCNKKTEESDNNLTSSQIIDKAKIFGETIPPLSLEFINNKEKIFNLSNARQCSSKRNSIEDDSPRKISMGDSGLSTNGKINLRDDSDESN
jgi:hypothetical protein